MKRFLLALTLWGSLLVPAIAGTPAGGVDRATGIATCNSLLPTNGQGQITAASLRQCTTLIWNSLLASLSNLSDVANAAIARQNLGVGINVNTIACDVTYGVSAAASDNTSAINACHAAAAAAHAVATYPAGHFRFTSCLAPVAANNWGIGGAGNHQTWFEYTGASATCDIMPIGDGTSLYSGLYLHDFALISDTVMTAGSGIRVKKSVGMTVDNIVVGSSVNYAETNLWDGFWADSTQWSNVTGSVFSAHNDMFRTQDSVELRFRDDIWEKPTPGAINGIHIGGGSGGIYVSGTCAGGVSVCLLVDTALISASNNQLFLMPDFATNAINAGVFLNDAIPGNKTITISSQLSGQTAGSGVVIINWPLGQTNFTGANITSNAQHGIVIEDPTTQVFIDSSTIITANGSLAGGYGVFCTVACTINSLASPYVNATGSYNSNVTLAPLINLNSSVSTLGVNPYPPPLPGAILWGNQADGVVARAQLNAFGTIAAFTGAIYGGTYAAKTAVTSGTELASLNSYAYNGSALVGPIVAFRSYAAENIASGHQGSTACIATTTVASTTLTNSLCQQNDLGITIGSPTGGSKGAGTLNAAGLYVNGVAVGAQTITLSGDVTGSGTSAITATLANIPSGVPAAGSILFANIAAPSTPASGKDVIYTDSTGLRFHDKNASGVIGTTVVSDTGATHNFLTGITTAGAITKAQPACGDLSNATASCSTDATNASNISSGTLAAARGGAGTITGALKGSGAGVVTQAACADLSNGATGCSTATGTSGATLPLLNGNNTWSAPQTITGAGPLLTLTDTSAGIATLTINGVGDSAGGTMRLIDSGGSKYLRSTGNIFQILNNAFTTSIFSVTDVGATSILAGSASLTLNSTAYTTCTGFTSSANVLTCTVSSKRLKYQLGAIPSKELLPGVMSLSPSIFSYRDKAAHGAGQHFGLYAEDVCAIDERLCVRDPEGRITSYEDRGVLALLVGAVQALNADNDSLHKEFRRIRR